MAMKLEAMELATHEEDFDQPVVNTNNSPQNTKLEISIHISQANFNMKLFVNEHC